MSNDLSVVNITPAKLNGIVTAPPSKSYSHRAIICGALSGGKCEISSLIFSEDILATMNGMKEIGANITVCEDSVLINDFKSVQNNIVIDSFDSCSTLRFIIPIVASLGIESIFKRSLGLAKRPMIEYLKILEKAEVKSEVCSDLSLKIGGKLKSGKFLIPGNISSQFVSGLLMALPMIDGNSEIEMTSKLESSKYVDITIDVMKKFGVCIEKTSNGFFIAGNQKYKPTDYIVEGDWSQGGFFMVAGSIGGNITIKNLNKNSFQGDKEIFKLLSKFGANISWNENQVEIKKSKLWGINIDASEIPDLIPILSVAAANAEGVTEITNAGRLKFKECDRLDAIYRQLKSLGVDIKKLDDGLIIKGKGKWNGGVAWSHNDHRIAMALSIMAINLPENLKITHAEAIKKSYPDFFEDYNSIGGKVDVVDMGK